MKNFIISVLIWLNLIYAESINIESSEQKAHLQNEEKKKLIVECANFRLESCDKLLNDNAVSVKKCDVRTECEFIGWLYAQVQNYTASLPYLQKACDSNHIEGCNKLGFSYQRLNNYKKAKKYYKMSCDGHNMGACFNLGMLYFDGLGVRHSYENANILYEKVCDSGEGIGCLHLGISHLKGYGVFKNKEKSLEYFKKGCALGNNKSCEMQDENDKPKE